MAFPFTGKLEMGTGFPSPNYGSNPTFIIGEDNNHYILGGVQPGDASTRLTRIGQCEDKSTQDISTATWKTDLVSLGMSVDPTTLTMSASPVPVPTTPYFFITGCTSTLFAGGVVAAALYKINSSGDAELVPNKGFVYSTSGSKFNPGWLQGNIVVGSNLYSVNWGLFDALGTSYLTLNKLPYLANFTENLVGNAFAAFYTNYTTQPYLDASTPLHQMGVLPRTVSGTIRLISYVTAQELSLSPAWTNLTTPGSETWVINPTTHGITTDKANFQSALGQPWSDAGYNYAGTFTEDQSDDYKGPNIQETAGGYLITFGRTFSDENSTVRFRQFFYDSALDTITSLGAPFEYELVGPGVPEITSAYYYKHSPGRITVAGVHLANWWFQPFTEGRRKASVRIL